MNHNSRVVTCTNLFDQITIGEMKSGQWEGKRTIYYQAGQVVNEILEDDKVQSNKVESSEMAYFGTGKPNNK